MADIPVSFPCADFGADALLQLLPAGLPPLTPPRAILQRQSSTDSVRGIMTDERVFDLQLQSYFAALSPSKQGRTTVTRSDVGDIVSLLSGQDDDMRDIKFRSWAFRNFKLSANDSRLVSTSNGLPIACVEQYYSICAAAHGKCMHGGRDKTHKAVTAKWAFIPKDIVARFVATCPLCRMKRPSMHDDSAMPTDFDAHRFKPESGPLEQSNSDGEENDCMIISPPPKSRCQSVDEQAPILWTPQREDPLALPTELLTPLAMLARADAEPDAVKHGSREHASGLFKSCQELFSPIACDGTFTFESTLDLAFDEQYWPGLHAEPNATLCERFALDWMLA